MKRFKVTYASGYETFEAADIFALLATLKIKYRAFFKMPIKIEEIL